MLYLFLLHLHVAVSATTMTTLLWTKYAPLCFLSCHVLKPPRVLLLVMNPAGHAAPKQLRSYVIVIAWGQGFMAVNQPIPEGAARGQGWFTYLLHTRYSACIIFIYARCGIISHISLVVIFLTKMRMH